MTDSENVIFTRNNHILNKKFMQFLIPAVLSVAATSLNEFLDSIVVAHTLGAEAMSMVNLACPIMMVMSTIFVLLGTGGSTLYAEYQGQMQKKKSGEVFSFTLVSAAIISILILVFGLFFSGPIAGILSNGEQLSEHFLQYIRVLFISAPLIILLQIILMFFPATGAPRITTIINIVANVVNIIFDYIYTTHLGMDVEGAAWATFTGYAVGLALLGYFFVSKKCHIEVGHISRNSLHLIDNIIGKGLASSLGQLGFCIKIAFSNAMAIKYAGMDGVVVFSACIQTISVVSIVVGGIIYAMVPIVAVLNGQKDYEGIQLLMRKVVKINIILSITVFILFEVFPTEILAAYNVIDAKQVALGVVGIRIFAIMYLFRQMGLILMYFMQVVGRKIYANVISIVDGFAGIMVISIILCPIIGITGLWAAYPATSFLLLIGTMIVNKLIIIKSRGRLKGYFILPKSSSEYPVLDITMPGKSEMIVEFSRQLQDFCKAHGVDDKTAMITAVGCEEMCVHTMKFDLNKKLEIDVLIKIVDGEIIMSFRSLGKPFDTLSVYKEGNYENMEVLMKLAKSVTYDFVIGMNQTVVVI